MRVGFVGLGLMGSRMAANLVKTGFEVSVHNRTRSRADALLAAGARWADTPGAAVEGAEVICTCVSDPQAMHQIFDGPTGIGAALRSGQRMVDFSTLSPDDSLWLDGACRALGASFLESPVTGSKAGAEAGTLVMMCGGSPEVFQGLQPVLQALGSKAIHVGPVGTASQVKLVGNILIAHMMEGLAEGAALARKAGISLEKVLEVVQSSGYASPYWDFKGKALAQRDFTTQFSIDLMHKDLTLAMGTGRKLGVPMPGTAAIREVYQLARAQGLGASDICATAAVVDPELAT